MKSSKSPQDISSNEISEAIVDESHAQDLALTASEALEADNLATPAQVESYERSHHRVDKSVPTLEETKARYAEDEKIRRERKSVAKAALQAAKAALREDLDARRALAADPSKAKELAELDRRIEAK